MTAIITVFCYDLAMQIRFSFCVAALFAASGAWAQSAPGGPLSPSAGWAAQRAGIGPASSQAAILAKSQFFLSTLSNSAIVGKTETVLRYGVTEKLSVGLSHLRKQGTLRPNANYTLTSESVESPSLNIGIYENSIGGKGSAFYATAGRTLSDMGPVTFSGYMGIAKVSGERAPRFLVGAALPLLNNALTASAQWEGKKLSLGIVGMVGTLGKYPIRFGLVAVGDTLGTLGATTWQR
nr:hypothetical protein [Armatimonas sp.]